MAFVAFSTDRGFWRWRAATRLCSASYSLRQLLTLTIFAVGCGIPLLVVGQAHASPIAETPGLDPAPSETWRSDIHDGSYTLHTIGRGDVEIEAGYVVHAGNCADCVPMEEAVANAPDAGGILHVHGGTYERGVPSLGKHTTVIGHNQPVFEPGNQWGGGPARDGWLVVSGIKTVETTLWAKGNPAPQGLFVVNSEMDGHAQGAIFTSQGSGLLEVRNTEIYEGGQGNVRHNVYSHSDVTVGQNVYSHSPNGSHAWKVVSDKQILRDSYITNVTRETVEKFEPLKRRIAEYFRYGTKKYDGLRPDEAGGPTGVWAAKPDWSLGDWRALYEDFRTIADQPVGTTPVDMISCADSWLEGTSIGFLRVPNAWSRGYAESGRYALEFRHRRTEIGGCDKPGWWESQFDERATWELGDVTDPANDDLLRHFIGADVEISAVGPRRDQVIYVSNRGTQPIDRGGSNGTREGVVQKGMPPYWKEQSRVFAAREFPRVLETVTRRSRCRLGPCATTKLQRTASIYQNADPATFVVPETQPGGTAPPRVSVPGTHSLLLVGFIALIGIRGLCGASIRKRPHETPPPGRTQCAEVRRPGC